MPWFIEEWDGFDIDGTLAICDENGVGSLLHIGDPVPAMVERIHTVMAEGVEPKIFSARASIPGQEQIIKAWLKRHHLPDMDITNIKDLRCRRIYDDRARQVVLNTGKVVGED